MEHPEAEEIEKYIVIDCDPGVDDCLALMIAFSQLPRIKIVGITTVRGNVDVRQVTMNALRVVKLYDKINEVSVYQGCTSPIMPIDGLKNSSFYHGSDGFGNVPNVEPRASEDLFNYLQRQHAVNAILDMSKKYDGKLQIVAMGPLTNLALAVRMDPDLPKRLLSVHVLGGTLRGHGNITPCSEYNFAADPEAANIFLQTYPQHCPSYLLPYEVTVDYGVPVEWHKRWLREANNEIGRFFARVFEYSSIRDSESIARGKNPGYTLCDSYLMCTVLKPKSVTKSRLLKMCVETGGHNTRGSLIIDHREVGSDNLSPGRIELIEDINMEIYQDLLVKALK